MTPREAFNVLWMERKDKFNLSDLVKEAWQTLETLVLTQPATNTAIAPCQHYHCTTGGIGKTYCMDCKAKLD